MATAAELYALQEIDIALDQGVARLADIEAAMGETDELQEARQVIEERRQETDTLRSSQSELEWAVDEMRTKAADVEKKLYSGTVGSPKELSDLDADVKSLKNQLRTREDALLSLLLEIDESETALQQAQSQFDEIEAVWRREQDAFLREKDSIEPEVNRLNAERETESTGLDRAVLNLYQLLRDRRGGQAVAKLERGMCQGCRITLPSSVLQKARSGMGLVQCVSCERILMVS